MVIPTRGSNVPYRSGQDVAIEQVAVQWPICNKLSRNVVPATNIYRFISGDMCCVRVCSVRACIRMSECVCTCGTVDSGWQL
jgi:hypothetical protein